MRSAAERKLNKCDPQQGCVYKARGGVGVEVLWLILWLICCLCAADLSEPYPIIVYSVANYRPRLSHFRANVIFAIPILVTF